MISSGRTLLPANFAAFPDSDGDSSDGDSSDSPHLDHLLNMRYKQKWKRLKKIVKTAIFVSFKTRLSQQ